METKPAIAALAALAQETRLSVYRLLVQAGQEGISVGDIGAAVKSSAATLSFHLKELTHAGLIDSRQEGRFIFYSANYAHMNELLAYLTENCCVGDNHCAPACATPNRIRSEKTPKNKPANKPRLPKRRVSTRSR